jgi:hypothetical protein
MSNKVYNFSLKIDDENNSLSETNGLSVKQLGQLLLDLDRALELNGKDCTLSNISGNCYQVGYSTPNEFIYNNYIQSMDIISRSKYDDLPANLKPIKKTLNNILGNNRYAIAYDMNFKEVAKITSTEIINNRLEYYTNKIIKGLIIQIGNKNIDKNANIVVREIDTELLHTIPVTSDQENALKGYYKYTDGLLSFDIKIKKDLSNNKSIPISLTSYKLKSNKKINKSITDFLEKHGSIFNNLSYAELISDDYLNEEDND